ncbi:hypothetical protein HAX54_031254, partial [Datura stramonium]|nr:hypothetical protein [Datura stramonium]
VGTLICAMRKHFWCTATRKAIADWCTARREAPFTLALCPARHAKGVQRPKVKTHYN